MSELGRPPLPPAKRRTLGMRIRMNAAELAVVSRAAFKAKMPMAKWVRIVVMEAANAQADR